MKIKQFLLLLLVLAIALPAVARKKTESLPLDKAVRIGKLSNGDYISDIVETPNP